MGVTEEGTSLIDENKTRPIANVNLCRDLGTLAKGGS